MGILVVTTSQKRGYPAHVILMMYLSNQEQIINCTKVLYLLYSLTFYGGCFAVYNNTGTKCVDNLLHVLTCSPKCLCTKTYQPRGWTGVLKTQNHYVCSPPPPEVRMFSQFKIQDVYCSKHKICAWNIIQNIDYTTDKNIIAINQKHYKLDINTLTYSASLAKSSSLQLLNNANNLNSDTGLL